MKYFTRKFINGAMGESKRQAAIEAHSAYISRLSPAMQSLGRLNLHDASVLAFAHDAEAGTLQLRLRRGDSQVGYEDATLQFSGVRIAEKSLKLLRSAVGAADVEVLASEVELVKDRFAFGLLLWPKGEAKWSFEHAVTKTKAVLGRR